jgi:membrane protease YdiL (CAAX protease family)
MPDVLATAAFALVVLLWGSLVASIGALVARDAGARGSRHPVAWAAGAALLVPVLGYYLWRRERLGDRERPVTPFDRALGAWALASGAAFVGGAVLAPPDPVSQGVASVGTLAVTAPAAYLLGYRRRASGHA